MKILLLCYLVCPEWPLLCWEQRPRCIWPHPSHCFPFHYFLMQLNVESESRKTHILLTLSKDKLKGIPVGWQLSIMASDCQIKPRMRLSSPLFLSCFYLYFHFLKIKLMHSYLLTAFNDGFWLVDYIKGAVSLILIQWRVPSISCPIIFSPNFNIHYLFIFFTFIVWQCSIMIGQYNLRCMLSNIPVIFFEAKFPTYICTRSNCHSLSLFAMYKSNIIFCLWVAELCQEF